MKITLLISLFFLLTSNSITQIVLNEVMANPSGGNANQGLINFNGNQGREYIELYNPSCSSIDVAGYFVACRQDVLGTATGGAFRIPTAANTIIAPGGHLVLGTASSSTVASNIDIVIPDFASNYCQNDPTRNFVMANTDGWIALYDAAGTPIDAIYWASNVANISNASDYGVRPCTPTGSPAGLVLLSAQEINTGFPGVLTHAGTNPSANQTFSRINDGQSWQAAVVPSIDNASATGNCNNGVCNQISDFQLNAVVVNPTCGQSNGSISFAPSPADTYFYTWSFPTTGQTAAVIDLAAGTYPVTITSASGCSKDTSIVLTEPSSINPTVNAVDPTCTGNDGTITLVNIPAGNFVYTWTPSVSTSANASGLDAGDYQISILDDNGCTWQTTVTLNPAVGCGCQIALEATITSLPNSSCLECNYNGPSILINEINIFPQVGDGSIFGPGPNVTSEGEWIELYNPNWCDSVDISGYILGSYNSTGSTLTVPFRTDGMAFVIPNGTVVPPLGFVVVRGQNAPAPPAGVVDVVVLNTNNTICIEGGLTDSRVWFQNTGGWFGFYDAAGVPQDFISWGAPIAGDLNESPCVPPTNSLPVGTTLTSYNGAGIGVNIGAANQTQTFVRIPDGGQWSATLSSETFSYGTCNDPNNCLAESGISNCNGQATVTPTNGVAPYTYSWNDPAAQTNATALNLCPGTYDVVVTDANGCLETFTVDVQEDIFTIEAIATNPTCEQNDGSISVTVSELGTYTYTWSPNTGISNTTTTSVSNLSADTYSVSVTSGGCTRDTTLTLLAPPPIQDVEVQEIPTSCGLTNGQIALDTIVGGTAPFTFNLNNQGGVATSTYSNLSSGSYSLLVTDVAGCEFTVTPITIAASVGITSVEVITTPASCGEANGAIAVGTIVDGNQPFTYSLNANESPTGLFENLAQGSYLLSIVDAEGCSFENAYVIPFVSNFNGIQIPNVFTPNQDDINERWEIDLTCIKNVEVKILNRWGNLVYETTQLPISWDGTFEGTPLTDGVYFYSVAITLFTDEVKAYHGHVTLKR
jgi:gliding motility-associated-like protein